MKRRLIFKMATIRVCSNCGSDNIELVCGGLLGKHKCNKCNYEGIFPEVEINNEKDAIDIEKKIRKGATK